MISFRLGVAFSINRLSRANKYWTNRLSRANMRGSATMLLTSSYELAQKATVWDSRCFEVENRSMGMFASTSGLGDSSGESAGGVVVCAWSLVLVV